MEEKILKMLQIAKSLNCPRKQVENFLKAIYIPLKWQWKFHAVARQADELNGPTDIGVGGARGPGKSHGVFAQLTLDDAQRVKGLKGLFLRKTGKSAGESFDDLIGSVLAGRIKYKYNPSKSTLKFPNGSKIILGGFESESDIDKYVGIQYDVIAIEERNQLSGDKVLKLKGSLRTVKPNWRARTYSSFNAGNIGHADIKKTFVIPYQENKETTTRFIPATFKDNPYLKPEYVDYLESLPGNLGKAWREGNFDTFEGQYFIEWDYNKHTCRPYPIPPTYKRYRAYDHGRENPACCLWFAVDYDGRIWVYREFYQSGWNVDQIATEIKRLSEGEQYEYSVADPSIFANQGFVDKFGGQTIAESFARQGITFIPASNRRVDGWNIFHQYLYWDSNKEPKIVFFNTCYNSIRTIPILIHDDKKPEDIDTKGEDHAGDAMRYGLMSLHERKTTKPMTELEREIKQHYQQEENRGMSSDFYYGIK